MKIKRILLITLALSLLVSTVAFGKAERIDTRHQVKRDLSSDYDVLLSDFMVGTSAINDWTVSTAGASTVGYAKTEGPDGKEQQCLLISDKVPGTANSGAAIIYNFPQTYTSGTVEVEFRFKMEVPNITSDTFQDHYVLMVCVGNLLYRGKEARYNNLRLDLEDSSNIYSIDYYANYYHTRLFLENDQDLKTGFHFVLIPKEDAPSQMTPDFFVHKVLNIAE